MEGDVVLQARATRSIGTDTGLINASQRSIVLIRAELACVAAIVIHTALRGEPVQQLEELHIAHAAAADVPHGEGLVHHVAVAMDRLWRPHATRRSDPHRRACDGIDHLEAQRHLQVVIGDDRACNGQAIRIGAHQMNALHHMEVGVGSPIGEHEVRLHPLRRHRITIAPGITHRTAPFATQVFAPLEARCIVEQEVRVTEVGERDVPVRIRQC